MQKIQSFQIDHTKLKRGIYVSRKDFVGNETITTFDIRMKKPNKEPVIDIQASHTIEHLGATFLRNHSIWGQKIIYFGPMGCRTGFYLLLIEDVASKNIVPLITEMFEYIEKYNGDIPGASAEECGNYKDHNLPIAKKEATTFLKEVLYKIKPENLVYPS